MPPAVFYFGASNNGNSQLCRPTPRNFRLSARVYAIPPRLAIPRRSEGGKRDEKNASEQCDYIIVRPIDHDSTFEIKREIRNGLISIPAFRKFTLRQRSFRPLTTTRLKLIVANLSFGFRSILGNLARGAAQFSANAKLYDFAKESDTLHFGGLSCRQGIRARVTTRKFRRENLYKWRRAVRAKRSSKKPKPFSLSLVLKVCAGYFPAAKFRSLLAFEQAIGEIPIECRSQTLFANECSSMIPRSAR